MQQRLPWAILVTDELCQARAEQLAQDLQRPLLRANDPWPALVLAVTPQRLEVRLADSPETPYFVDFNDDAYRYRVQTTTRRDPMVRAVGLNEKHEKPWQILDATAGFGQDGFLMAYLGAQVTLLEREPIMAALLQDGLQRAGIALPCYHIDAKTYLAQLEPAQYPDVIYLDPMFTLTKKSALANKNLQFLQNLCGEPDDSQALLQLAISHAKQRVVVKRSVNAAYLADQKPHSSLSSKQLRFDIYRV